MPLGTWCVGDPFPNLPTLPSFSTSLSTEKQLITSVTSLSQQEIEPRFHSHHRIYLALLQHTPVAYGWIANHSGRIDEIHLSFTLPPRNRYLWDFLTLSPWRDRGIYPLFLQTILRHEQHNTDRFWILSAPVISSLHAVSAKLASSLSLNSPSLTTTPPAAHSSTPLSAPSLAPRSSTSPSFTRVKMSKSRTRFHHLKHLRPI